MYAYNYNHLKTKYSNRVQLLYTDTDSVIIRVKTEDLYQDMIASYCLRHLELPTQPSTLQQHQQKSDWKNLKMSWLEGHG